MHTPFTTRPSTRHSCQQLLWLACLLALNQLLSSTAASPVSHLHPAGGQHSDLSDLESYLNEWESIHGRPSEDAPMQLLTSRQLLQAEKELLSEGEGGRKASGRRRRRKRYVIPVSTLSTGHYEEGKGCAPGCEDNGVCNYELGRCDCPRGWTGRDCSQAPDEEAMDRICKETHFYKYEGNCTDSPGLSQIVCVNSCNGRGKCRGGWCHCDKGFWGADCSMSMGADGKVEILSGRGYKLRAKKPHVYIYDLPHRLTSWRNPHFSDRPLHLQVWHRLLAAGCVTTDGDTADYFYFPVSVRGPSEGLFLEAAINYVQVYWPYWDRYSGAKHLVIHTGDTGRAELTGRTLQITANVTFLTHWGLTRDYPFSNWKASHIENRDIVIPIHMTALGGRSSGLQVSPLHPTSGANRETPKDIELLFAGRICGGREEPDGTKVPNCAPISQGYSQGVRQEVHQHHWNRTGFRVAVSIPKYFNELTRTRFCLAPTGGGHGHRQILVAFSGCTPLIISDYVLQPFEPALNWTRFGVTLPQSDIPRLHEILPKISAQRYKEMQDALPCAAQHFAWSTSTGGFMHENGKYDAFETTLEILRMMAKYPGIPHNQFENIDPEFRAFMECRSDQFYEDTLKNQAANNTPEGPLEKEAALQVEFTRTHLAKNPLCSLSKWDGTPCEKCLVVNKRTVPGGALCCDSLDNLAACPRLWP